MDEFKAAFYTEEEVAGILGLEPSTMRRRILNRTKCPPHWSPTRGVYYFPKAEFVEWCQAQGLTFEVENAS